jgi:hypothetical protein
MKTFKKLLIETKKEQIITEAEEWGLIFQFDEPEYTSKEGREIQRDLERKFKRVYSGSGSGGDGWDVSFNGSKKELEKAKKYVESKYKKFIDPKYTVLAMDESFELDEAYALTFEFPDDRKAKQFDLDIENSAIGEGDRVGNKVTVTNIASRWRAAVKKFMQKNKGKLVKESVELDEASQRWADEVSIPASKQTTDIIQSGKAKILLNLKSALHPSARFVVIQRPMGHRGELRSNQDKVLMATTSDPERGRIKMFAFHGTHVNEQGALKFAKNHKLITKPVTYYQTHESVQLDEGAMKEIWQEIHDELKKEMDPKWYRELQSSNGGQALENIIGYVAKRRGYRVDKTVAEILDRYGRNHKEYVKLSFAMAARNRIAESVGLEGDLSDIIGNAILKSKKIKKGAKESDIISAINNELSNMKKPKLSRTALAYHMRDKDFLADTIGVVRRGLKESVELGEAVDHNKLHKNALQIMKDIDRAEGRKNKWVDSWGDKVKNTINPQTDTNSISTPAFYGGRNTNWQFSLIKDGSKIIVKYDYLGPASKMQKDMKRVGSSGTVNIGVFTDMVIKMNESVELDEGKAWDAILRIKEQQTAEKVHGMLVDMQTAKLLCDVYYALNTGNQKKFMATIDKNAAGLKKMVDFAWKQVK